jgi:Mor family transcriptional regulator
MPRQRRLSPAQEVELCDAYKAGATARELGSRYRMHHESALRVVKRARKSVRAVGRPKVLTHNRIDT